MFVTRMLTRLALVGTAVFAVVTLGVNAAYAVNGDCAIQMPNYPQTMTADVSSLWRIKLQNDSPSAYPSVKRLVVIQLNGLSPSGVSASRAGTSLSKTAGGAGNVVFTDPDLVAIPAKGTVGATQFWNYDIRFSSAVPAGTAQIKIAVYDGTYLINSTWRNSTVVSPGRVTPSTTPKSSPTTAASATARATTSVAAGAAGAAGTSTPAASADPNGSASPGGDTQAVDGSGDSAVPVADSTNGGHAGSGLSTSSYVIAGLIGAAVLIIWRLIANRPTRVEADGPSGPPGWYRRGGPANRPGPRGIPGFGPGPGAGPGGRGVGGGYGPVQHPSGYTGPRNGLEMTSPTEVLPPVRPNPRGPYAAGD